MYSIDINLLRERAEYQTGVQTDLSSGTISSAPAKYSKIPLYAGVGVAILALLGTGGGYLWLGQQTTQLEAKQKDLDQKLGSLQAQDRRLTELNGQVAQITGETQSLASVFNQVQPWSAVLQDLRESIPQGVQIDSVVQSDVKFTPSVSAAPTAPVAPKGGVIAKISTVPDPEAKPAPGAAPKPGEITTYPTLEASLAAKMPKSGGTAEAAPAQAPIVPSGAIAAEIPTTKLDIVGTAKSFDEVNNFILTLKQSAFFNPDETQLLSTSLMPAVAVTRLENKTATAVNTLVPAQKPAQLELPRAVEYKIQTSLKRVPAADLIRELERKGAVGLVTRLKSIQQQVVKP
jgi:type IV pilus assembly protein PilN